MHRRPAQQLRFGGLGFRVVLRTKGLEFRAWGLSFGRCFSRFFFLRLAFRVLVWGLSCRVHCRDFGLGLSALGRGSWARVQRLGLRNLNSGRLM